MSSGLMQAVANGREFNIALWLWPTDGRFARLYLAAREAKSAVEGFHLIAATIAADERRSALAKEEDRNAKGIEWLRTLGRAQRQLNTIADEIGQQRRKLSEVAPASPTDAVIDVAIAQRLFALSNDMQAMGTVRANLMAGADPRVVTAVLRMPTFLTGLSERFVARVSTEEIRRRAPGEANQMEQLGEALEETQRALLNGYTHIHLSVPNLPIGDQQQAMGDGAWQHLLSPERVKRLEILEQGLKQLVQESEPAASEDDKTAPPKKVHWRERLAAAEAAEAGQSMPTIN